MSSDAVGRRHPGPVPTLRPDQPALSALENWLRVAVQDGFSGLPAPHEQTHLQGGSDPLDPPAAVTTTRLNTSGTVGSGPAPALEDHDHPLDLLMTAKGDLVTHDGAAYLVVPVGAHADGEVLTLAAASPGGFDWAAPASPSSTDEEAQLLAFVAMGMGGVL